MKSQALVLVYTSTLLLSAALLFSVQPMFSKMILPLLGGTSQVWNTAMLFFQNCLLAGYGYAHLSSYFLKPKAQGILHLILLAVFSLILPFAIPEGWEPPSNSDPTLWQLSLMGLVVGGPFFILAASAPMLQRWFSFTDHKDADNPYFLYAASNLGSMSALLSYPVLIEPLLTLQAQSSAWMYGYWLLLGGCALSYIFVHIRGESARLKSIGALQTSDEDISLNSRFFWVFSAFVPSSLLLGVTTYITTDIASVPLLWVLPLSLYVGTFIFAFARRAFFSAGVARWCFDIFLISLIIERIYFGQQTNAPVLSVSLHLATFFFCALVCHMALVRAKPSTNRLTEFYLLMSLGGALGGVFNAIIAPQAFIFPLEYGLILIAATSLRYSNLTKYRFKAALNWFAALINNSSLNPLLTRHALAAYGAIASLVFLTLAPSLAVKYCLIALLTICLLYLTKTRWAYSIIVTLVFCVFPLGYNWGNSHKESLLLQERNFFGIVRVTEDKNNIRTMTHGTTIHGTQSTEKDWQKIPTTYYANNGPVGDVMRYYDLSDDTQKFGVIGLGVGSLACYTKDQRHFDFFEIDPDIARIASDPDYFTFLPDCGSYSIILGDGRLTLQKQPNQYYSMVVLDAFSSDNIPVHLLTIEALNLYRSKIKEDGLILINISNNYVDLEPVIARNAQAMGIKVLARLGLGANIAGTDLKSATAHWVALTQNEKIIDWLKARHWSEGILRENTKVWSDQYSNIIGALGTYSGHKRYREIINSKETKE